MFKKAALLLSGNAFGSLMLLVRNLAVARLVSVEDYGIAATFAISMAIVEMASGLGLQQLIVQDKKGEDPELQAGLQGFNVLRGIFSGAALFLLATPIAKFLGIPDVAWAYQLLALVPVIRGFEHFDIYRLNRSMQFGPLIISKTLPALLSVLSVWPFYLAYGDYRVMLYSVILHWLLTLATAHVVAKRRYQLRFSKSTMQKGFLFGWPLLINNIILFVIFQGDKIIVGRELGMETLAIFAMGVTFTLTPTLVSAASEQQFFLPQLSAVSSNSLRFNNLALATMQTSFVAALCLVLFVGVLGQPIVSLLLGEKYEPLIPLFSLLAIWQAIRALKVGNTVVALSLAQTSNAMLANGVRALALPVSWYILTSGGTIKHIIWVAICAELAAYFVSLWSVTRKSDLNIKSLFVPLVMVLTSFFAVSAQTTFLANGNSPSLYGWGLVGLTAIGSLMSMRDLHRYIRDTIKR